MHWLFFREDRFLQELDLDNKIKNFVERLESKHWVQLINEVFVVSYDWEVEPIYFLCAHKNCPNIDSINQDELYKIKERKIQDFEYFIKNFLEKQCLINHEWIISKDQSWSLFDWVFRMNEFFIWINNSEKSLWELFDSNIISEKQFLNEIKIFYKDLLG